MAKRSAHPRAIRYVEAHTGLRAFFLGLLLAGVLGLGFRLYFSPPRLKAWVTRALEQQKRQMAHPFALSFSDVSLRLSQGAMPQLAVVVSNVRVAPNPDCHPEASVFVGELRLPFRVFALLQGRAAVGVVGARDITVDLDGLRRRCEQAVSSPASHVKGNLAETAIKLAEQKAESGEARPWWTEEQFETVRSFVEGLEFSRATLQFEAKRKEIYLDSFSARFKRGGLLALETEIRIPPPATFGEQVPALKIEGEAVSTKANLVISARLSEGSLATTAVLTPSLDQALEMDAHMSIKSVPLSMLTPLMRKAGLVNERFQPKFMWLDCSASISGPFQGLFQRSPLRLEACRIEGDGTDIQLANAERSPQGVWLPFDVQVVSLDLAKLFNTIGVHGPEGVAADFGKLDGRVHVESPQDARFVGQLRDAGLSFSSHKLRAIQEIDSATVELSILKDHIQAEFKNLFLLNGQFSGSVQFSMDRALDQGLATADFKRLKFDPTVQSVLVGGTLGDIDGHASVKIEGSHVTDFESNFKIGETSAQDYSFERVTISGSRTGEAPPILVFDAPVLHLKKSSAVFQAVNPIFFTHVFHGDDLELDQPHIEATLQGDGEIVWSKAKTSLERGQIAMSSAGSMNRDHVVDGWLQVDFPKVKKLKWILKGPLGAPHLQGSGDELKHIKERAEVDDKALGLKDR